jgi:hypothetical protein
MGGFGPPTTFFIYTVCIILYILIRQIVHSQLTLEKTMERLILNILELAFAIFCITVSAYQLGKFNSKPCTYEDE